MEDPRKCKTCEATKPLVEFRQGPPKASARYRLDCNDCHKPLAAKASADYRARQRPADWKPTRRVVDSTLVVNDDGRQCSNPECLEFKPWSEFYPDPRHSTGHQSVCKLCKRKSVLAYAKTDAGKKIQRRANLKFRFGVSEEQYWAQLEKQGGGCAICGVKDPAPNKWFSVDHDHACCNGDKTTATCGKCIRGLICLRCNNNLGWYEDFQDAITAYLAKPPIIF